MAGVHFEFVSPETVLFSGDVDQVDLPGIEGDLGVLPGHAPMVTLLRPGIVTIMREGQRQPVVSSVWHRGSSVCLLSFASTA